MLYGHKEGTQGLFFIFKMCKDLPVSREQPLGSAAYCIGSPQVQTYTNETLAGPGRQAADFPYFVRLPDYNISSESLL